MDAVEKVEKVPWIKRWIICKIVRRKEWKTAHAYNRVACDLLLTDNHSLGEQIKEIGNKKWLKLYRIE